MEKNRKLLAYQAIDENIEDTTARKIVRYVFECEIWGQDTVAPSNSYLAKKFDWTMDTTKVAISKAKKSQFISTTGYGKRRCLELNVSFLKGKMGEIVAKKPLKKPEEYFEILEAPNGLPNSLPNTLPNGLPNSSMEESPYNISQNEENRGDNNNNINNNNNTEDVISIFNWWNDQEFLITHRVFTASMKKSVKKRLEEYSKEDLALAIQKYNTVLSDSEKYWLKKRWTLLEFMKQDNAMPNLLEKKLSDYLDNTKKTYEK